MPADSTRITSTSLYSVPSVRVKSSAKERMGRRRKVQKIRGVNFMSGWRFPNFRAADKNQFRVMQFQRVMRFMSPRAETNLPDHLRPELLFQLFQNLRFQFAVQLVEDGGL